MLVTKKSFTFKENLSHIIENSKSKSKIFNINYYIGNFTLNALIFFKLVDLNYYLLCVTYKKYSFKYKKNL